LNKVFKNLKFNKIKWHEKLRLFFVRKQYIYESDLTHHCSLIRPPEQILDFYWEIIYKKLKGKVFILEINEPPPPHHVNCRCSVLGVEKGTPINFILTPTKEGWEFSQSEKDNTEGND
jgi:hypothetical protein